MFAVGGYLRRLARIKKSRSRPREWILEYAKQDGIGAELGVFEGSFSAVLASKLRPKKLFLVDPWWKLHGDRYPDLGPYTDYGRLETRTAYESAVRAVDRYRESCDIQIVIERSQEFLRSYDGPLFDWIYLDSSHQYEETLQELLLAERKLAPNAVILGDDWKSDPRHRHYGVFMAVQEFVRREKFEIIAAGYARQWAIRRTTTGVS